MKIVSLQLKTFAAYEKNLKNLLQLYQEHKGSDLIVAPEVSLTGFDYDNFEAAAEFSKTAEEEILNAVGKTPLIITLIEKIGGNFYNTAKVFYQNEIIHTQSKYKLFLLGNEEKYFSEGKKEDIKIFTINGIKYGILICFELRFTELWQKLEGVDVLIIPAAWGKLRKSHLEKLSNALAIANRCFVIVSDSANDDMAKSTSIITPFGEVYKDDRKEVIAKEIDLVEIKKIKRFIPYS